MKIGWYIQKLMGGKGSGSSHTEACQKHT